MHSSPLQAGLDPTRQIVHSARDAGFSDVHDYLVHLVTGEPPDVIAVSGREACHTSGEWEGGGDW